MGLCPIAPPKGFPIALCKPSAANTLFSGIYDFDSDSSWKSINHSLAFGKAGEFAEKYLHKGTKIIVSGKIQTGSYTNKDGQKVYTTEIVAEEQEFAESKKDGEQTGNQGSSDGFMNIPDGIEEDLPFSH